MGTLIEEILSQKVGRQLLAGEILLVDVDYIMSHDNTTPLAIKAFREIGKPIYDKNKIVLHFDHAYPAPNLLAAQNHKNIIDFVRDQNLPHLYRQGVCHQVMIEAGFVTPGAIIIGADSHTNTYGALGAFGAGLGSTEVGVAWVTGKAWFKVPETIRIEISGQPQPGVYAKDVMIHIVGILGMDGATYRSVEFGGPYIQALPMSDRIVFANMSTEIGAKCGLITPDAITHAYLENYTQASRTFRSLKPSRPQYERSVEFDISALEPQIACHPNVDNVKSITAMIGLPIDEVYIGTCTNARYADLEIAAQNLAGKRVHPYTRTIITPASNRIYQKALENGLIKIFMDAGCIVTQPGCGACIGRHGGILAPGERALTTMNRNFIGRMGSPEAEIYLASPATAAVSALTGLITDPRDARMA
jgi:3-isopropylmalate/(R)-2-methylmalate dehydratase large subunit